MAYSLTAAQIAALTAERDQLQTTVDGYDSDAFIAAVNASIVAANEVDLATLAVWQSTVESTDGTEPRERVLSQLDGLTPNASVDFGDMDVNQMLYDMGAIQPVIDDITTQATGSTPRNIENSRRIRLSTNRYYPDVDDKDDKPDSDGRNVFPDHPWFAYSGLNRSEKDYQDLVTLFQAGIFGNGGRGTPATIAGSVPDDNTSFPPGQEASGVNAQTQVVDGSQSVTVGDNERFFIYSGNFLNANHTGVSIPTASRTTSATSVNNLSITRGTTTVSVAGTCNIVATFTETGSTMTPATCPTTAPFVPAVGNVLGIGGSRVLVIQASPQGTIPCLEGATDAVSTATTPIRYLILNSTDPANGTNNVATGDQTIADSAAKRTAILGLKRFTTAIPAGATNIATPAINTQSEVSPEITRITGELGSQTTLIYRQKYSIANVRCNWNDGTLSGLISRENSRLNLFNPQNLVDMGLIPSIIDYVNEYTRTRDKIAELQAILDGAS